MMDMTNSEVLHLQTPPDLLHRSTSPSSWLWWPLAPHDVEQSPATTATAGGSRTGHPDLWSDRLIPRGSSTYDLYIGLCRKKETHTSNFKPNINTSNARGGRFNRQRFPTLHTLRSPRTSPRSCSAPEATPIGGFRCRGPDVFTAQTHWVPPNRIGSTPEPSIYESPDVLI